MMKKRKRIEKGGRESKKKKNEKKIDKGGASRENGKLSRTKAEIIKKEEMKEQSYCEFCKRFFFSLSMRQVK